MDDFTVDTDNTEPAGLVTLEEDKPGSSSAALFNLLAIVFLGLTALSFLLFVAILINPTAPYNPFPPDSAEVVVEPTVFVIPTLSPSIELPPPTATLESAPTEQSAAGPTATGIIADVTATPAFGDSAPTQIVSGPPTATSDPPVVSATQPSASVFPFVLQPGTPTYTQNTDANNGCDFTGIAGQVFDINGIPAEGLAVRTTGTNFDFTIFTGTHIEYGPSGYQVELNNTPIEDEFEIQLFSPSGQPLSDKIIIRTRATCEENLILVNFVQVSDF